MPRWLPALVAGLGTLTGAARLSAQLPPEKALATLKPADGLQVELFAAEPMVINPTSIDVDHKGRVWVCEAVNYRRKAFGRPIIRKEGDRIVVLVDINGDGLKDIVTGKRFYAHHSNGDVAPKDPAVLYWFELKRGADKSVEFIGHKIDDDSGVGTQVVTGDLSGDGKPDVVVGNKKGTFVFIQQ